MSNAGHLETIKTVLIAEDDPNDVHLLQLAARHCTQRIQFRIVRDGAEAVGYLKGEHPYEDRQANPAPALVLLDVRMPKLDGFQVLNWIRSTPEFRDLKVFVWADSEYQAHVNHAKSAGADRIVKKPAAMDDLKRILTEVCDWVIGPAR
jgi:CheY-like chemotaxis protein